MSTMWLMWVALLVAVGAIAFAWLTKTAADKSGDELVQAWGEVMPRISVITMAPLLILAPGRGTFFRNLVLWGHHAAFLMLGLFLLLTLYSQISALLAVRRKAPNRVLASIFRRLWILTELMPAPIALAILLSGLRLVWETPVTNSVSQLWLLVTVALFGFFFWDGILGFRPIARELYVSWSTAGAGYSVRLGHTARHLQISLHVVSYPFVLAVAASRWDSPSWLTQTVGRGVRALSFLPVGWPEVVAVVVLWLIMGVLITAVRRLRI